MAKYIERGEVRLHCTGCGRDLGLAAVEGFATVSNCQWCNLPDGFKPPPEWNPDAYQQPKRKFGTTIEDMQQGKTLKELLPATSRTETKGKRKTWMSKKTEPQ